MAETILITGGAGFIGRYISRALLAKGHRVRVLDSLIAQVHAHRGRDGLDAEVELVKADIRDGDAVSCDVLELCLAVSRDLLEGAPDWLC